MFKTFLNYTSILFEISLNKRKFSIMQSIELNIYRTGLQIRQKIQNNIKLFIKISIHLTYYLNYFQINFD